MDSLQCSPALNASQGITANPDISGIGVRTAIYTQAVISLIHPIVAGYDGKIDDFEMRSLATVSLGILLPGCALLVSAIIQAQTFGLSAYHAMIVLFLSWINNTSALTFFAYIAYDAVSYHVLKEMGRRGTRQYKVTELDYEWAQADGVGKWGVLEKVEKKLDRLKLNKNGTKSTSMNRHIWELEIQQLSLWRKRKIMTIFLPNPVDSREFQRRWKKEWENNKRKQEEILQENSVAAFSRQLNQLSSQKSILLTGALASMHLTLLSGFGWWFWSTLPNFGINQECIPNIRFVFFTKSIPITSAILRSVSKSVYIFSSLPGINVFIWFGIFSLGMMILPLISAVAPVSSLIELALLKWAPPKVPSSSQPVSAEEADSPVETTPPSNSAKSLIITMLLNRRRLFTRSLFALIILTTLIIQTFLITFTELTIAHNQHLIQSKEGDWTFGQTLALTLTVIPLIEVVKFLWEKRPGAPKESGTGETWESV